MNKLTIITAACLLAISVQAQPLEEIKWMSEHYAPYNYVDEDGTPKGITLDILMEMFKKIGLKKDPKEIKFLPWARSYRVLQREPGTALFSMTYTPERTKLFKFVGPIIPSVISLIAHKNKHLKVKSVEELSKLRIGAIREDIGEQLLLSLGVDKKAIEHSNLAKNMVRKLHKGRIDAIAYSYDIALWHMKKAGIDPNQYESVYTLEKGQMGYAFNKDTDQSLVDHLQRALDSLKADGTVDRITKKYLH